MGALLSASIGDRPSLRGVLRLARPTPKDNARRALFGWLVDPQDTILSLPERLAKYGGGGTDCSLPLVQANNRYAKRRFAGVVLVSDNESRVYAGRSFGYGHQNATGVMTEWQKFVAK